ncbi:MAG: STAS domain-containing protein [Acidimicrobiales bacterium]|nr:STAS domain-containing protein [Acidimicrobiales bacterium]
MTESDAARGDDDDHETLFRTQRDGAAATVIVEGDIDIVESDQLEQLLLDLVEEGYHEIVVDLQRVAFIGSTGLGSLVAGQNQLAARGGELRLRAPTPSVRRVLSITALDQLFTVVD